jgi:serine/threonine-protein kinase
LDYTGRRTLARAALALSSDGDVLAFTAAQAGQPPQLYVRRSSDETARALPGTLGAEWPFFSPDGAWLGFWADDQLKKIRLDGGPPVRVCDINGLFGASWAPDGTIVFAGEIGPLMAVSPASPEPRPLTRIPPGSQEVHRLPHVLPDGSGVLFTALDADPLSLAEWETARVEIMTFASAERQVVLKAAEDGRYLPTGHLLYARGDTVEAMRFDLASRRTTGSPVGIVKGVMRGVNTFDTYWETGATQLAVSDSGTMVYVSGGIQPDQEWRFAWLDRRGRLEATPIPPGPYGSPSISPDGARVAFRGLGSKPGVWIWDFARSNLIRVTSEASNRWPLWSRDGSHVVYSRLDDTGRRMLVRQEPGGGTGAERQALCPGYGPAAWSPDGKTLVFTETGADGYDADIMLADLSGQQARVVAWRQRPIWDGHPALSPNGKWLAYASSEAGALEVYVESFPKPGSRQKVSTAGGREPTWAPGGDELFFMGRCASGTEATSWCFFAVPFREGSHPIIGRPRSFAEVSRPMLCGPNRCYDIAPDGRRFLVTLLPPQPSAPSSATHEMHVVLNWFEELKAKVPTR